MNCFTGIVHTISSTFVPPLLLQCTNERGKKGKNVQDFALGLSVLVKGSEEEKLRWTFNMYDLNGDGVITRDEMEDVVASVSSYLILFLDHT